MGERWSTCKRRTRLTSGAGHACHAVGAGSAATRPHGAGGTTAMAGMRTDGAKIRTRPPHATMLLMGSAPSDRTAMPRGGDRWPRHRRCVQVHRALKRRSIAAKPRDGRYCAYSCVNCPRRLRASVSLGLRGNGPSMGPVQRCANYSLMLPIMFPVSCI